MPLLTLQVATVVLLGLLAAAVPKGRGRGASTTLRASSTATADQARGKTSPTATEMVLPFEGMMGEVRTTDGMSAGTRAKGGETWKTMGWAMERTRTLQEEEALTMGVLAGMVTTAFLEAICMDPSPPQEYTLKGTVPTGAEEFLHSSSMMTLEPRLPTAVQETLRVLLLLPSFTGGAGDVVMLSTRMYLGSGTTATPMLEEPLMSTRDKEVTLKMKGVEMP